MIVLSLTAINMVGGIYFWPPRSNCWLYLLQVACQTTGARPARQPTAQAPVDSVAGPGVTFFMAIHSSDSGK